MDILTLAGAVTGFMEWVRSLALQVPQFTALSTQLQALILQIVAFAVAYGACYYNNVNIFPQATAPFGLISTAFFASLGSAGIHLGLAFINGKSTPSVTVTSAQSVSTASRQLVLWS